MIINKICIQTCSYVLNSFFCKITAYYKKNKYNDNNEKTLKIMKRIIFILLKFPLFPLETIQFGEM